MGRKKKPAIIKPKATSKDHLTATQLINMFKLWLDGKTLSQIAQLFYVSESRVRHISAENKWGEARRALYAKQHALAMESMQTHIADIVDVLADDFDKLNHDRLRTLRQLNKDERKHALDMLDRFMKEARLEAGKPTEISNDTSRIEIILPPGAAPHYGIPPTLPNANTTYIEAEPIEDKVKTGIFNLDPEDVE